MTQTKKYSLRNNNSKNKKNGNNKQVHRKCNLLQFQPFSMFCMLLCLDPNRCKKYHVIISTQKQVSSETECTSAGSNPAGIHMFKMNQRNTRTRCEICSKLTIKTPERHYWKPFLVFKLWKSRTVDVSMPAIFLILQFCKLTKTIFQRNTCIKRNWYRIYYT